MKLGLRAILALSFLAASIVPLAVWAVWVSASALDREIREVEERHLLLAQNLSLALDRYAQDVAAVFSHVVESEPELRDSVHLGRLLDSLNFRHICLIETDTRRVISVTPAETVPRQTISLPPLDEYIVMADQALGELVISDARRSPGGYPVLYMVQKIGPNLIAFGELGTDYLRETQRAVAFGEGGHAALFDAAGNVLGHPRADWVEEVRNQAQLDPVARMMAGETGVSTFYSPAANLDMIAGFTTVPSTGWGIMIPQPIRELEEKAEDVEQKAYLIVLLGAVVSTVLGFIVGGFIAAPIRVVTNAADRLADGDSDVVVPPPRGIRPVEIEALTTCFNDMTGALDTARKAQRRALQAAEEAVEAKSDFVTRVTHELRTPLNSVIGFSGMIRDQVHGPINRADYVEYGRMIHDSGQRLLEMVNDIIAYARIDGRGEELSETVLDIQRLAKASIDHVMPMAEEGGVELVADLKADMPLLRADEIKLRQALTHLLGNAVKFTPKGGTVHVRASLTENGGLAVSVTDTGIGIAEEDIPTALSPFGQISSDLARAYEGAGLGLPLSKMLVELHGGSLRLRSILGKGTEVTLIFPPERVGIVGSIRERLS